LRTSEAASIVHIITTFAQLRVTSGDRKGIEERTKVWDELIVDRRSGLSEWAENLGRVRGRKIQIYSYANNDYAGYGPATVETFLNLWERQVRVKTKSDKLDTLFPM